MATTRTLLWARCTDCDNDYQTVGSSDYGLCQRCDARDRREYAVAYAHDMPMMPRTFSKAAMRDRLGVTGDTDE